MITAYLEYLEIVYIAQIIAVAAATATAATATATITITITTEATRTVKNIIICSVSAIIINSNSAAAARNGSNLKKLEEIY